MNNRTSTPSPDQHDTCTLVGKISKPLPVPLQEYKTGQVLQGQDEPYVIRDLKFKHTSTKHVFTKITQKLSRGGKWPMEQPNLDHTSTL